MSEAKHTPGPWCIRYDYVVQAQSFEEGRLVPVAQPYGVNSNGTDLFANARLIAAAPELLEAAIELKDVCNRPSAARTRAEAWRKLDKAIAKATGEQ